MIRTRRYSVVALALGFATLVTLFGFASGADAFISSKLTFFGKFGQEVNKTQVEAHPGFEQEDLCLVESGDTCQTGKEGKGPSAFSFPEGVAVGPVSSSSDVYVSDKVNGRIQVFSATGAFLSMWGWDVNKTKSEEVGTTQAERDICTSAEIKAGDVCQAGQTASAGPSGQIAKPTSIVVSQVTGDVYVLDFTNHRVEKYTPAGTLVWMIGGEVNKTKVEQAGATEPEKDLCVAGAGDVCQAGVESVQGTSPHGAFKPSSLQGDLLALSGSAGKEVLYLGDEGRIVEFDAETGAWKTEVPPGVGQPLGSVTALAVDGAGHLYSIYREPSATVGNGVWVLEASGTQVREIDSGHDVRTLALDPFGRLAVVEGQTGMGVLFDVGSGTKLSEFGPAGGFFNTGLAFNLDPSESKGQVYATTRLEVEIYKPVPVVSLTTKECIGATGTSVTLTGEANPNAVEETKAWFEYGTEPSGLTSRTAVEELPTVSSSLTVEAVLGGLRPNQTYNYRLAGEDKNYKPVAGEQPLFGATLSCATEYLPPVSSEPPTSYYVTFSTAVLSTSLNPENAKTHYAFEYWPCIKPEASRVTSPLESSEYATIDVVQGISELQPSTEYCYALVAESENKAKSSKLQVTGPTGHFVTAAAPKPTAVTGGASNETTTSATLSGIFDADGASATYSLLVGEYRGAQTVYGTVMTASIGAGVGTTSKTYELTGLAPGVTYAYVAKITSPYGTVVGQPVLFKTIEVSSLVAPEPARLLPSPIGFPKTEPPKKKVRKKKPNKKHRKHKKRRK